MSLKSNLWIAGAAFCMIAAPVGAQAVYKCGARSYSQLPCSTRIVGTAEAPVPRKAARDADAGRREQNRILARSMRRLPGETAGDFQLRRRRAAMLPTDRDECARLDTRLPLERARMASPMEDEVRGAQDALSASKERFRQLRC